MVESLQLGLFQQENSFQFTKDRLISSLSDDLNFHNAETTITQHNYHSFPAKFPPQLPRKFINTFTQPGDIILDPMMGSGTTIIEASMSGRQAIGVDIDPLALLMSKVKTTNIDYQRLLSIGDSLVSEAELQVRFQREAVENKLETQWNPETKKFIDYWFDKETQIQLLALKEQIEKIAIQEIKDYFLLVFSSIIVTKSGGVSLALDLGHTRPHRAKYITDKSGNDIISPTSSTGKTKNNSKIIPSAFEEFRKKFNKNMSTLISVATEANYNPLLLFGNAQYLPLHNNSVDLIVTSPPYASNAIDYMRAHKFSLVWMGFDIQKLTHKRREYIGNDNIQNFRSMPMPQKAMHTINQLHEIDKQKSHALLRYFSEMSLVLNELYRVLKPNKTGFMVVGNSIIRGIDVQTDQCLAEIAKSIGFEVPKIGKREIDRNKRMLPVGHSIDTQSQIQNRMHEEYIIGLLKM